MNQPKDPTPLLCFSKLSALPLVQAYGPALAFRRQFRKLVRVSVRSEEAAIGRVQHLQRLACRDELSRAAFMTEGLRALNMLAAKDRKQAIGALVAAIAEAAGGDPRYNLAVRELVIEYDRAQLTPCVTAYIAHPQQPLSMRFRQGALAACRSGDFPSLASLGRRAQLVCHR